VRDVLGEGRDWANFRAMTPQWERAPAPPVFDGQLYMDAVLRPHRSLSFTAFRVMLIVVIVANLVAAMVFIANGAFPVAGFLGLDVLALWLAFRWNYRAARIAEYVRVGAHRVHVASVDVNGEETHWVLNPVWARVLREGRGVLVRSGERQIRLGAFLSPKECESLVAALDVALHRARRG
jgi:uncharacterized membrane protein